MNNKDDTLHAQQPCGCENLRKAAQKMVDYIDRNWPGQRSERLPVQELREALAQPCQPASVGSEEWHWEEKESGRYEMFCGRSRLAQTLTRGDALTLEKYHNAALRQPAPAVAKIAAEVAADLEDYVEIDKYGFGKAYKGYRTADAQEMIERAFAGLEPKLVSADVEQIARDCKRRIQDLLREHDNKLTASPYIVTVIADSITAALAPLQAELNEAKAINSAAHDQLAEAYCQNEDLRARLETAEAELEQVKANRIIHDDWCSDHMGVHCSKLIATLQARLATAEADTKRLDWMEHRIEHNQAFVFDDQPGKLNLRAAIDKAKGAQ